jgi:four helix bundle protein
MDGYSPQYQGLRARTKEFGLRIIRLFRALPRAEEARVIGRQFLRSGTSVGANYRAACRSRSRADFIAKLGIVLEEADETSYWLETVIESEMMPRNKVESLLAESDELIRIFVTSINTAERQQKRPPSPRKTRDTE